MQSITTVNAKLFFSYRRVWLKATTQLYTIWDERSIWNELMMGSALTINYSRIGISFEQKKRMSRQQKCGQELIWLSQTDVCVCVCVLVWVSKSVCVWNVKGANYWSKAFQFHQIGTHKARMKNDFLFRLFIILFLRPCWACTHSTFYKTMCTTWSSQAQCRTFDARSSINGRSLFFRPLCQPSSSDTAGASRWFVDEKLSKRI